MRLLITTILLAATASANVRVNLNLGVGHPIRRSRTVVVWRTPVVVAPSARVVYAAPVAWTRAVVARPPSNRLVWEDSEVIQRNEDWVDSHFSVKNSGDALILNVDGRAQVDFAEVHFGNGQVQVVDFNESLLQTGTYRLMDFGDGRRVDHVRVVARARTPRAKLTVVMKK